MDPYLLIFDDSGIPASMQKYWFILKKFCTTLLKVIKVTTQNWWNTGIYMHIQ